MGFRAKGFHEKNGDGGGSSNEQTRKRTKHDDDDESDDDDSNYRPPPKTPLKFEVNPQYLNIAAGNLLSLSGLPSFQKEDYLLPKPTIQLPPLAPLAPLTAAPVTDAGQAFLETASALITRFYTAGVDTWSTVLSLARMLLVSKGWSKSPTMEDALRVLNEYEQRYPGCHLIIFDPATRQLRDRVVALSPSAVGYLGPIGRNQNGLDRRLVPMSDAWAALTSAFAAYRNPGMEISADISISCQDGVHRPATAFFAVYPNERMLVVRAIPRPT
jgi:hypothetical protein